MLIKIKWICKVKTDEFVRVPKNKARLVAHGFRKEEGIDFEDSFVSVSLSERVKISSTNIRLETTVPQKEETFQVVIDLIKNSTCFKAFTISADVLEIFMTLLYIRPRVEGVDFTDVPDDDSALTFIIDLGYKGPLYKHTNMFVDHMHQLWRTLATIINKCLSGKRTSNDKLKKFKIDILGKGSQGKKTVDDSQKTVDVSKESEPEPAKKQTSSKRRVKKKVTLFSNDNIISDDPDAALDLAKSISQTEAEEAK
nr:retrovirus-related Pol polyprotein from transposon TNT 1-94 [Tanacetum cinerariifolium]